MSWDPKLYLRFKEQRMRPFQDLVNLLQVREGLRVVDLGCGTGELTRRLADLLPLSQVIGLDNSPEMLAGSQAFAREGVSFELRPLQSLEGPYDLIFSHAALQWVDQHTLLFERLWAKLAPGGQLLVQMPYNFDNPSHRLAAEVAEHEFGLAPRQSPVLTPVQYAHLLFELGCPVPDVSLRVYPHVLPDADALCEWTQGTLLTAYLSQLDRSRQADFLDRYRSALRRRFHSTPILYTFPRIFISALKGPA